MQSPDSETAGAAVGKQEKQAEKMSSAPSAKLGKREKLRKAGKLFCVGDYPGLASGELVGKLTAGTVSHVDLQVGGGSSL